jgi:signal transduction histidine kinase
MSVVLLLSLGAFGLLINHYQDQLMEEVARTASEAGRAALSTLEFKGDHLVMPAAEAARATMEWHASGHSEARFDVDGTVTDDKADVGAVKQNPGMTRVIRRVDFEPGSDGDSDSFTTHSVIMIQSVAGELPLEKYRIDCETTTEDGAEITNEPCVAAFGADVMDRFFISIEGVEAETDPAEGLVLKVPRFTPGTVAAGTVATGTGVVEFTTEEDDAFVGPVNEDQFEELRVPLASADYGGLFKSIRDRSLFVFLGVLAVGTVLSAGVASRFTRPIRRLDSGIRRLSHGDLDVQVPVQGKDEIARLGRAFNDMTRSLRANRQRSRELVRREKLSALGRLAAGVAHDVRNPLHSIGLTLDHLREACRPEDDRRAADFDRSVEIIRGEVHRLDRLVGNFLRFARSDPRMRRSLDLQKLLAETARLVRKEAEWRDVRVALELGGSVPPVLGDGEAIRSSILNLVLNSFEAMPEGGKLTLSLREEQGEVIVDVADTGAGIPEEDQEKVFEFAFTTREGGYGLGLAMVHQCIVEDHGGRVGLHSRPGEGTRVRIVLPACDGEAVEES